MLMDKFDNTLNLLVFVVFTGLAVVAFAFAALAREDAYRAADKQTKKFWLILLGVNLALNLLLPAAMFFLLIAGVIAAIVFMVDVRPALAQVSGGGGRRGGSSSDGPYGPYNGGR